MLSPLKMPTGGFLTPTTWMCTFVPQSQERYNLFLVQCINCTHDWSRWLLSPPPGQSTTLLLSTSASVNIYVIRQEVQPLRVWNQTRECLLSWATDRCNFMRTMGCRTLGVKWVIVTFCCPTDHSSTMFQTLQMLKPISHQTTLFNLIVCANNKG